MTTARHLCFRVQILAHGRRCPIDMQPLQHTRLDSFKINFTLKDVIESSQRDAADEFKLRSGQIAYDTDGGSFLGRGSSGDVYRGARASRPLASCSGFKLFAVRLAGAASSECSMAMVQPC